ncbi:MAG: AI-2E family transporter [Gammaproteobacteria bacterium]|nr:AI-2E family transporter [Gammaproteobacteria bacterium]
MAQLKYTAGIPVLLYIAAFVIVVAGMQAAKPIIIPFLLSIFIAIISAPPLFWLEDRGLPRSLAMIVVITSVIIVVFGLGALVGSSLKSFSADLPFYQERLTEQMTQARVWAESFGFEISLEVLTTAFDPAVAMKLAAQTLNGLGGALGNVFLILLTVVFILFETSSFPRKLRIALGDQKDSLIPFQKFTSTVKNYLAIKSISSLLTAVLITLWLVIIGVDYPLLWGLLVFMLNFVPNIGSIIAAIPVILLALVQLGTGAAISTAIGFLVVNVVVGNILEPRFMGRGLGLSPLVVFLSLVFWGWVLGPVGMFLSVPLTMTIKIALDSRDETHWLAVLLGTADSEEAAHTQVPPSSKSTL